MKRIIITSVFALMIGGCAGLTSQSPPTDVALIPNDCANSHRVIPWLKSQLKTPKGVLQSNAQYQESIRAIKHRIWSMRYYCEPVDDDSMQHNK